MTGLLGKDIPKRTGYFKSFDGTEIYYEMRGHGEPTIWVYGIACLMNHWHHQLEFFSKSNTVVSFDLRGHNQSSIPKDLSQMTVKAMAQDLIALMDHLELKQAHLMGHSFGVPVLIEFSSMAPERALSYTFVNGFARNPIQGMFGVDLVEKLFKLGKIAHHSLPEIWNPIWKFSVLNPLSFLVTGALGGFNLKYTEWKDIEIYAKGASEMSLDMFIPLFEDMTKFNGEDLVQKITAPALILAGAKDFVTPLSFQESLHRKIKNSRYVVIEQGSHCTQLDLPDIVNAEIMVTMTSQPSLAQDQ